MQALREYGVDGTGMTPIVKIDRRYTNNMDTHKGAQKEN